MTDEARTETGDGAAGRERSRAPPCRSARQQRAPTHRERGQAARARALPGRLCARFRAARRVGHGWGAGARLSGLPGAPRGGAAAAECRPSRARGPSATASCRAGRAPHSAPRPLARCSGAFRPKRSARSIGASSTSLTSARNDPGAMPWCCVALEIATIAPPRPVTSASRGSGGLRVPRQAAQMAPWACGTARSAPHEAPARPHGTRDRRTLAARHQRSERGPHTEPHTPPSACEVTPQARRPPPASTASNATPPRPAARGKGAAAGVWQGCETAHGCSDETSSAVRTGRCHRRPGPEFHANAGDEPQRRRRERHRPGCAPQSTPAQRERLAAAGPAPNAARRRHR